MTAAHVALNRFGLGARPGQAASISADPKAWLKAQIQDATAAQIKPPCTFQEGFESAYLGPTSLGPYSSAAAVDAVKTAHTNFAVGGMAKTRLSMMTTSTSPFLERMAMFWTNHFAPRRISTGYPGYVEVDAVRPNLLGTVAQLADAAIFHGVTLMHLDNFTSSGPNSPRVKQIGGGGLNENLGREVLELYLLGEGNYSQTDVTELSKALTGWTVRWQGSTDWPASYDPNRRAGVVFFDQSIHEPGARTVVGKAYAQSDGTQARTIVADLAKGDLCYSWIALKLARHLHSDAPPATLVAALKAALTSSGGSLKALYTAAFDAPELWDETRRKARDHVEWIAAIGRALPNFVFEPYWLSYVEQDPWGCRVPKGFPIDNRPWTDPGVLKTRWWTSALAGQGWAQYAPASVPTFAADILGTVSPAVASAMAAVGTRDNAVRVLFTSPDFMMR